MSSTAKTFDGSAIATTSRPSSHADRDRLVPAGEGLAHERRDRRVDDTVREVDELEPDLARERAHELGLGDGALLDEQAAERLARLGLLGEGRVELRLRQETFGDEQSRPGCSGCPTGSASSSSPTTGADRAAGPRQLAVSGRVRGDDCAAGRATSVLRARRTPAAARRDHRACARRPRPVGRAGMRQTRRRGRTAPRAARADSARAGPCAAAVRRAASRCDGDGRDDDFRRDRDAPSSTSSMSVRHSSNTLRLVRCARSRTVRRPVDLHDEAPRLRVDLDARRYRARRRARAGTRATGSPTSISRHWSRSPSISTSTASTSSRTSDSHGGSLVGDKPERPACVAGRRRNRCRPCGRAIPGRR